MEFLQYDFMKYALLAIVIIITSCYFLSSHLAYFIRICVIIVHHISLQDWESMSGSLCFQPLI